MSKGDGNIMAKFLAILKKNVAAEWKTQNLGTLPIYCCCKQHKTLPSKIMHDIFVLRNYYRVSDLMMNFQVDGFFKRKQKTKKTILT